jgi:neutral trehalase
MAGGFHMISEALTVDMYATGSNGERAYPLYRTAPGSTLARLSTTS